MVPKIDFYEVITFEKPTNRILFVKLKKDVGIQDLTKVLEEMRALGISCTISKKERITEKGRDIDIYLICNAEGTVVPLR